MTAHAVPIVPAPGCKRGCELSAWVDHDRLLGLEANGAVACAACLRHARLLQSERRLVVPLRPRSGRRTSGSEPSPVLDPCTWQEAVETATLAMRQAQVADHALVWLSGSVPSVLDLLPRRIGRLTAQCTHVVRRHPSQTVARVAATLPAATAPPQHDLLVVWGGSAIDELRESAAPRIVVDPRGAASASGILHLAVRPGADGTLAAAWSARFESPARALGDAGGVDAAALDEACRLIRSARAPLFALGPGLGRYPQVAWSVQSIAALATMTGAAIVAPALQKDLCAHAEVPANGKYRLVGSGALSATLASLVPRQTVVVIEGGDPLTIPGHHEALRKFLRQAARVIQIALERDTVTPYADLIIPALSPWERSDRRVVPSAAGVREGKAALAPPRDLVGEMKFWRRVARSMDWPESWFPVEVDEWTAQATAIAPWEFDAITKGPITALRETGEGPSATPELYAAYRLWMVPGRGPSEDRWDTTAEAVPEVAIAAIDAQRRGLMEGAAAVVHNPRGALHGRVRVSEAQAPGIVSIDPAGPGGAQLAALAQQGTSGPWAGENWACFLVEVSPP